MTDRQPNDVNGQQTNKQIPESFPSKFDTDIDSLIDGKPGHELESGHGNSAEIDDSQSADDSKGAYNSLQFLEASSNRSESEKRLSGPPEFEEIHHAAAAQNQQAATVNQFELEKSVLNSKLESLDSDLNESPVLISNSSGVSTSDHRKAVSKPIRTQNSAEVYRSFLWLASLVLFFLVIVSFGPTLLERYRYAWTKGSQQAKHDLALKALPAFAKSGHPIVSELVVHKVRPSVVSIEATVIQDNGRPTNRNAKQYSRGQGSGVIISNDGLIVTNNHVVNNARQIVVTLPDRRELKGTVVGTDPHTDLAVIKVNANDLTAAQWGDSSKLELGSQVWAIGSPFGLEQTVTKGILSGKHRAVSDSNTAGKNPFQDLLQTDAAINPGNSGGPLVNSNGEIIGINVSIYGDRFQGISFAVPSSLAKQIVEKLIEYGKVERGFLGIRIDEVRHRDQIRLGLSKITGAKVTFVEYKSAAEDAGIMADDVITKIGGKTVENTVILFRQIGLHEPGTSIPLEIVRNGEPLTIHATVGNRRMDIQPKTRIFGRRR